MNARHVAASPFKCHSARGPAARKAGDGPRLAATSLLALLVSLGAAAPCWPAAGSDSSSAPSPSPKGALLRSAFYPGWGQLANRKPLKACLVMAAETYLAGVAISADRSARDAADLAHGAATPEEAAEYEDRAARYRDRRTAHLWWLGAAILYSMLDAYVDTNLAGVGGAAAGPPPVLLDSGMDGNGAIRFAIAVTF